MQPTAQPDASPPSATRLLEGVLTLVETSRDIGDFSAQKLQQSLGVAVKAYADDRWGAGGQLDDAWWYGAQVDHASSADAIFTLGFSPADDDAEPAMTSICQLDFNGFRTKLQSLGLKGETTYGSHGSVLGEKFSKSGMQVEVLVRGEAETPDDKVTHLCVQSVVIR